MKRENLNLSGMSHILDYAFKKKKKIKVVMKSGVTLGTGNFDIEILNFVNEYDCRVVELSSNTLNQILCVAVKEIAVVSFTKETTEKE